MRIDVWSDFVCPFCYIGKRHLEAALKELKIEDEVDIIYHSYELDPKAPYSVDKRIDEVIANKYSIPLEQAQASNERIINTAKAAGLNYNFKDLKMTNSFDAHRLSQYAKTEGKMAEFNELVFRSYFIDSLLISDHGTLLNLAVELGLDKEKVQSILKSDQYKEEVREDERTAGEIGISGVPFFIFNKKEYISGAQPVEVFVETIKTASK